MPVQSKIPNTDPQSVPQPTDTLHVPPIPDDDAAAHAHLETYLEDVLRNRKTIALENLDYLRRLENRSQNDVCDNRFSKLIASSTLSSHRSHPENDISLRHIAIMSIAYGYDPETFMGQSLSLRDARNTPSREVQELFHALEGSYSMAFFSTGAQPGSAPRSQEAPITTSVITFFLDPDQSDKSKMTALAFINCSMDEYRELTGSLGSQTDSRHIREIYTRAAGSQGLRAQCLYRGELEIVHPGGHIADVTLRQQGGADRIHLQMRVCVPDSVTRYPGGLATMQSVSKNGDLLIPSIQTAILSRKQIVIPINALSKYLYLSEPPQIDLKQETPTIVAYMKDLYTDDPNNPLACLSEEDKQFMLESFIERKLNSALHRSQLTAFDISAEMDTVCADELSARR